MVLTARFLNLHGKILGNVSAVYGCFSWVINVCSFRNEYACVSTSMLGDDV